MVTPGIDFCIENAILSVEGFLHQSPEEAAITLAANTADHYALIALDPPDPDFRELTLLPPVAQVGVEKGGAIEGVALVRDALATEAALVKSVPTSIERHRGGDSASDGEWALIHAREIRDYTHALADQLARVNAAMSSYDDAIRADTRDLDKVAAGMGILQDMVAFRSVLIEDRTAKSEALT